MSLEAPQALRPDDSKPEAAAAIVVGLGGESKPSTTLLQSLVCLAPMPVDSVDKG